MGVPRLLDKLIGGNSLPAAGSRQDLSSAKQRVKPIPQRSTGRLAH
jgi:hypothetical protein